MMSAVSMCFCSVSCLCEGVEVSARVKVVDFVPVRVVVMVVVSVRIKMMVVVSEGECGGRGGNEVSG